MRLIEANMPVGSNSKKLQVDAAGSYDFFFIAGSLGQGVRGIASRQIDPIALHVSTLNQCLHHIAVVGARVT